MGKKFLAGALAAVAIVISLIAVPAFCLFFVEIWGSDPDTYIWVILSFAMAALIITAWIAMQTANTVYDEADGYKNNTKRISRWTKNLAFADLWLAFLVIWVLFMAYHGGATFYRGRLLILWWAVLAAGILYLLRYTRYTRRRAMIRTLKYQASSCDRRRFHFTVLKAEGNVLEGYVQGTMKENDQVYAILPGTEQPVAARILTIHAADKEVRKAKDIYARVTYDAGQYHLTPYTVLSSQRPMHQITPMIQAENPRLSGMVSVYTTEFANSDYISLLNYDICHGQYLIPATFGPDQKNHGDMMEPLPGHARVAFLSVNSELEPDKPCLPVFTDWDALGRYGYIIEEPEAASLVMDFNKCTGLMNQGYTGIVINPFGPRPFYLAKEYVQNLTQLKGYQEEFAAQEVKQDE